MSSSIDKAQKALNLINSINSVDEMVKSIKNKTINDLKKHRIPVELKATPEGLNQTLAFLEKESGKEFPYLTSKKYFNDLSLLEGNIENYIGMAMIPTGVIGPVRVIGTAAHGDFYVPMSTTEGALIASYHRGAKACYMAGGATSVCIVEGVQRSPVFRFNDLAELGTFISWLFLQFSVFEKIVSETSRFAKLTDLKYNIEGNQLIVTFEYHTGDASGQNMVTLCTDAICRFIVDNAPVQPQYWFIESNYSGDKKATALSFTNVRGKKVTSEIILPEKIVTDVLKTTTKAITDYWRTSTIGIIQSGSIGAHGHYANGLTALFIATGQDAACVAEAAFGITRMEVTDDGNLYASVTLPNLIVGTVGGGTSLPTQKECLQMMDCYGAGKARKFAEICGAVVLAGELSIAAALSAGHFSSAHKKLGRKTNPVGSNV